jgi:hypothetical protein
MPPKSRASSPSGVLAAANFSAPPPPLPPLLPPGVCSRLVGQSKRCANLPPPYLTTSTQPMMDPCLCRAFSPLRWVQDPVPQDPVRPGPRPSHDRPWAGYPRSTRSESRPAHPLQLQANEDPVMKIPSETTPSRIASLSCVAPHSLWNGAGEA